MKYRKEYLDTKSRDEFISLVLEGHSDIKPETAKRRWYDLRKKYGDQASIQELNVPDAQEMEIKRTPIPNDDIPVEEPGQLKLLQYLDMKRYKHKTTRKYLSRQGFTEGELNWMDERSMIETEA